MPKQKRSPLDPPDVTWVDDIAWSPDGKLLALASGDYGHSEDTNLFLWVVNVETRQVLFTAEHYGLARLKWSPNGDDLFVGSGGSMVERYDVATGTRQAATTLRPWHEAYRMDSMDLSPDGKQLIFIPTSLRGTQQFTLCDAQTLEILMQIDLESARGAENSIEWVGYNPDGRLLATVGWDGLVRLWDVETLTQVSELRVVNGKRLYGGAWRTDGLLAVGGDIWEITVWDVGTQQILHRIPTIGGAFMRWHPDGRQFIVGGQAWDALTGQVTFTIPFDKTELQSVVVHRGAIDLNSNAVLAQAVSAEETLELDASSDPFQLLASFVTIPPLI